VTQKQSRSRSRGRLLALVALAAVALAAVLWLWPTPEPEPEAPPPEPSRATDQAPPVSPPPPPPKPRVSARADLQPLAGLRATGTVALAPLADHGGVRASYQLRGLMPGTYALRVHEQGDCSAQDGSSAGPVLGGGDPAAAELARMEVNATRFAKGTQDLAAFELGDGGSGSKDRADILGRSVVVETVEGIRVACGVIRPR